MKKLLLFCLLTSFFLNPSLSAGNTQDDLPREWEVAKRCFTMLDGKVPYALAPGNHDYHGGARATRINEYFPVEKTAKWPSFGGVFEEGKMENCYHLARIGDKDWIILVLEYGPRDKVLEWTFIVTLRNRRILVQEIFWDHAEALKAVGLSEPPPKNA